MKARWFGVAGLASAALLLAMAFAATASAADKADASGTWKWTREFNGNTMEFTLKLTQEGEKLTGTLQSGTRPESKIEEGKVAGNDVSFQITRERNGQKNTMKYTGKIEGDTMKLKSTGTFGGQERTSEFEAKRAK